MVSCCHLSVQRFCICKKEWALLVCHGMQDNDVDMRVENTRIVSGLKHQWKQQLGSSASCSTYCTYDDGKSDISALIAQDGQLIDESRNLVANGLTYSRHSQGCSG